MVGSNSSFEEPDLIELGRMIMLNSLLTEQQLKHGIEAVESIYATVYQQRILHQKTSASS